MTTYRFTQDVGYDADGKLAEPIKYPSLYANDEDSKVTAAAAMWDVPGDPDDKITMTRYYAAQRTFWVDPESGTIVKEVDHANHYFARDPLKPEVTMVDYKVTSNEETIESQVNAARNERDRLALWSRVLPISFTASGVIALIGGYCSAHLACGPRRHCSTPGWTPRITGSSAAANRRSNEYPAPRPRPRSCRPRRATWSGSRGHPARVRRVREARRLRVRRIGPSRATCSRNWKPGHEPSRAT